MLGLVDVSYICYQLLLISIKKDNINDVIINLFIQTTPVHYIHNDGNCCCEGKVNINHIK